MNVGDGVEWVVDGNEVVEAHEGPDVVWRVVQTNVPPESLRPPA